MRLAGLEPATNGLGNHCSIRTELQTRRSEKTSMDSFQWEGKNQSHFLQDLPHICRRLSKRFFGVPDFHYDALADGIATLLSRAVKGPLLRSPPVLSYENPDRIGSSNWNKKMENVL